MTTWMASPLPARLLRRGDRLIDFDNDTAEATVTGVDISGETLGVRLDDGRLYLIVGESDVTVTAPGEPVDGYALRRATCGCLYRRSDAWARVHANPNCRTHRNAKG